MVLRWHGLNAGRDKNQRTGRDREDKNRTEGLGSENDASRERMTQMSIAGGKRRRMARREIDVTPKLRRVPADWHGASLR
ncbi:hypothetical protein D4764_13G0010580 [Takifugu flavidus]|uniref:Uncharacterized protein n=1 Tax=Takifugu flavidus TaxID=433684 RepID=A0A5C6PB11_9TELE|nr:hypothetical protein D4764_13G0010580 [Takifugu flavidus]